MAATCWVEIRIAAASSKTMEEKEINCNKASKGKIAKDEFATRFEQEANKTKSKSLNFYVDVMEGWGGGGRQQQSCIHERENQLKPKQEAKCCCLGLQIVILSQIRLESDSLWLRVRSLSVCSLRRKHHRSVFSRN